MFDLCNVIRYDKYNVCIVSRCQLTYISLLDIVSIVNNGSSVCRYVDCNSDSNFCSVQMSQSHLYICIGVFNQKSQFCLSLQYKLSSSIISNMEPEGSKRLHNVFTGDDQQLKQTIITSYHARSQQQVKEAEYSLINALNSPGFLARLINLMLNDSEGDENYRKAIAVLIKKFSYDYAQKKQDKSQFIQSIFDLVLSTQLQFKVKEMLGVALEHQFNFDQSQQYKKAARQKIFTLLQEPNGIIQFDGLILVALALLNSEVEMDDQIDYFLMSIEPIGIAALKLMIELNKLSFEEWLIRDRLLFPRICKLFQYFETAIERIIDELDQYKKDFAIIRQNEYLISVLQQYLLMFHNNHSMVSQCYPQINPLKITILNIVSMLYRDSTCPTKLFQILYLTFLAESKTIVNDLDVQRILVHCLSVLTTHLQHKIHYNIFMQHKMQTIFALFMYSSTNQEEFDSMESDPTRFVQFAEEYTEAMGESTYLKVKAANMLQVLTATVDQAPRNILQILMVVMTGALQTAGSDTQIMTAIKQQFARFNFFGLSDDQKLETSFMILSTISVCMNKRADINKVIYAFFLTQFQILIKINTPIVILRMMRVISYYPCALYFLYIEMQMSRGKIYIIEGIKALQRILKTNKFAQLFQFLAKIFAKLIGVISITDPVMELLVINNYQRMLKGSPDLYMRCRNKIKQQFFLHVHTNQHATLICFNLLSVMIKKQNDENICNLNEKEFYQISEYLQMQKNADLYNRYQQKLVEVYLLIISKHIQLSPEVQAFAERSLHFLPRQQKGTLFFKFYNKFIIKLDGAIFKLQPYYKSFSSELKRRFVLFLQNNQPVQSIAYYCFLMSQIIGNYSSINLTETDMQDLLSIAGQVNYDNKQYPLIVFLTYLYVQPYPAANFLKKNNMYEGFIKQLAKVKFQGKIINKIQTLALIKLMEIQDNPHHFKTILSYCIHNLSLQNPKTVMPNNYEVRPRRLQDKPLDNEQQMDFQDRNDNQLINLFVKFNHPFANLSEYDQFKVIYWQNNHCADQLTQQQRNKLRIILETEEIHQSTRVIRRIKKDI